MKANRSTQEKILHFGKQEFLQHGFQNASLRNIASAAGLTTGAIYTYFKDKNALYEAIVSPICTQVEEMFTKLSASYYNEEGVVGEISIQKTNVEMRQVYRFIYDNFDIFRLLVVYAEGSSKADYVHTIVDYEVEYTMEYLKMLKKYKGINNSLDRASLHLVSESYINAIFEPVRHNMSFEQAIKNLEFLSVFYTGGWKSVLENGM